MTRIFTIGYASTTPEEIAGMLEEYNAILVDVRIKPYSRDARWNLKKLQQYFGSRYLHVGELGNIHYKGGPIQLADPATAINKLRSIISNRAIILLCVCYSHEKCHRSEAARILAEEFSIEVHHLYGSGEKKATGKPDNPEQFSLFE